MKRTRTTPRTLLRLVGGGGSGSALLLLLLLLLPPVVRCELDDLIKFMNRVEDVILEFARQVEEEAYPKRCQADVLQQCQASQYSSCKSALPISTKTCPPWDNKPQLHADDCGDGRVCNGWVDFSMAAVRLPDTVQDNAQSTPDDRMVVETVCFGPLLDEGMKARFEETAAMVAQDTGVAEAPFLYFGASDGAFRIYPARPTRDCQYDPRSRPWYVAASSTPKSVVLVMDISGYPKTGDFKHVRETAKAFVQAMAHADRVSVVFMGGETPVVAEVGDDIVGSEAYPLLMDQATNQVQKELVKEIGRQRETLSPNTTAALDLAFDLLETTIGANVVDCDVALVLLTSDKNLPILPQDLIEKRKAQVESLTGRSLLLFGYSTGVSYRSNNDIIASLECRLGAVWSLMDSSQAKGGIVQNVRLFHEAFSYDLGRSSRASSKPTWSEPYKFHSWDLLGTTIAAPVFDRHTSSTEPLFLGVVGIDMAMRAFEQAVAPDAPNNVRIQLNARQRRQCGTSFTPCDWEALRRRSRRLFFRNQPEVELPVACPAASAPKCNETDIPRLDRTACPPDTVFPTLLFDNLNETEVEYSKRTCCAVERPDLVESGNDVEVQCPNVKETAAPDTDAAPSPSPVLSLGGETTRAPVGGGTTIETKTVVTPEETTNDGGGGGLIVGIIVAVVVVIGVVLVVVWKRNAKPRGVDEPTAATTQVAKLEI